MQIELLPENQQRTNALALPSCGGLALRDDTDGQKALAVELYDRFHAMKTYGKEPESLESITRIFKRDLAEYPTGRILQAISTHAMRCDEFPTVSDIVGLIQRNGRPPLRESDIIAIRKKDGADRSRADWKTLEEWERQQSAEWGGDAPAAEMALENRKLRETIARLEKQLRERGQPVEAKQFSIPKLSPQQRVDNTIAAMRAQGKSDADIEEFRQSVHFEAA